MSEANETNDMLTSIKAQIMIATHETGEMPRIRKNKKKADSNGGYFYDAQNNTLYLKDEQTWNAIEGNLSADLSSDDMGINVSIQPLQGIDGYQGESIEDLQDKVDKVNRENYHEYYRLIKRGDYDCLLCYSFNNVADRDRFAAEMDDALVVGNSDVGYDAKFDKYDDDEEIDEDFSDDEVLDAPSHRKQNDNGKQKDTQKEKAKVNKKKQKDNKKKKNDDDTTKDSEDGEHEVTLVEELGDSLENQTGGTQVNDNSVSGNAGGAGKPAQSIEARFAAVNAQRLPNRYAYLEQYCRIAKEFGEPDGYSLSKDMGKRKAFEVGGQRPLWGDKDLRVTSRENLLMHMLADILPAIAGGKVEYYRGVDDMNTLYFEGLNEPVDLDSVLNYDSVCNSVFFGYFHDLIDKLKPLASQVPFTREQTALTVINFVMNDVGLMREFLDGEKWGKWKGCDGVAYADGMRYTNAGGQECAGADAVLPYDWMRGCDFTSVRDANSQRKWRLTPRTVGFRVGMAVNETPCTEVSEFRAWNLRRAAKLALDCGDVFPSGNFRKDMYYWTWAEVLYRDVRPTLVGDANGRSFRNYFARGNVDKDVFVRVLKQLRANKSGKGDFIATRFSPELKVSNLKKVLSEADLLQRGRPWEVFGNVDSSSTPPIIRNYNKLQNLNNGFGRGGPNFC